MGIRRDILRTIEAGVMGLFLFQAIRYLYGTIYSHVSSADLTRRVIDQSRLVDLAGYVEYGDAQREIYAVLIALLTPLLALLLSRTRWSIPLAVSLAVVGRMLTLQATEAAALASAIVVGGCMLYLTLIIMRRPRHVPVMLLLGVGLDMLVRATNSTIDPTWDPEQSVSLLSLTVDMDVLFIGIAAVMVLLSGVTTLYEIEATRHPDYSGEKRGTLSGWSSLALGAFLFVELTLFGLPNVVALWGDIDYPTVFLPLFAATLLPLIPWIRVQAGNFLGSFQGNWRGWIWMLLIGFLVALGHRTPGIIAIIALILAQFLIGLALWWIISLRDDIGAGNPTPILMLVSLVIFAILSTGDYFTYDYAFVRDFAAPFTALSDVLRSMRDFGLWLFLLSIVFICLPMILERRVLPYRPGREGQTFVSIVLFAAVLFGSSNIAEQPTVVPPARANCFRVATLNIHSGYTLLFEPNVERIAESIQRSGADVVLLQEVDRGRLSSFGVDQAYWIANELGMEIAFFPQNEFVQGIAVLSRLPIDSVAGQELPSVGAQAAVQRVILLWDNAPIYVYNVWLGLRQTGEDGLPLPDEQQDQNRQHDGLVRYIAQNHDQSLPDPIILGGTFNYDENSPLYANWAQLTPFEDPFSGLEAEREIKTLFLVDGNSARYDYIWLNQLKANAPEGVGIDQDFVVSDHRLAVSEILVDPNLTCNGLPELPEIDVPESDAPIIE